MPMDHRIEADYYLYGIALGIISFDQAISWADKIIEAEDEPDIEIIEVALSRPRGRNGVLEALKEVKGSYNPQIAGAMLLADLYRLLKEGDSIKSISRKSLDVARATQMLDEIRWKFDHVDDDISLAEQGIYADIDHCKTELGNLLLQYKYHEKT